MHTYMLKGEGMTLKNEINWLKANIELALEGV